MQPFATLLLITALSIPTSALVLRDGVRIDVDGAIHVENGRATFRVGGTLYSVPAEEVDLEATRTVGTEPQPAKLQEHSRLRVNESERDRLLRDLEQNHEGKPAPAEALKIPPGPTAAERAQTSEDEWSWRGRAWVRGGNPPRPRGSQSPRAARRGAAGPDLRLPFAGL